MINLPNKHQALPPNHFLLSFTYIRCFWQVRFIRCIFIFTYYKMLEFRVEHEASAILVGYRILQKARTASYINTPSFTHWLPSSKILLFPRFLCSIHICLLCLLSSNMPRRSSGGMSFGPLVGLISSMALSRSISCLSLFNGSTLSINAAFVLN